MFDNFLKIDKRTEKQIIGAKGEQLACDYLIKNGYKIIDRNYWKPYGEIDVVAQKGSDLYFIEVKTVSSTSDFVKLLTENPEMLDNYQPEDNIHPWKIKRLSKVIEIYLSEKNIDEDQDWQVDAICVYLKKGSDKLLKIEYLEDIM